MLVPTEDGLALLLLRRDDDAVDVIAATEYVSSRIIESSDPRPRTVSVGGEDEEEEDEEEKVSLSKLSPLELATTPRPVARCTRRPACCSFARE
jgi:hypothetical protein